MIFSGAMPLYQYRCKACAKTTEEIQRITDKPLRKCPRCSKRALERQIAGGTTFQLRGGGWAASGYASSQPARS